MNQQQNQQGQILQFPSAIPNDVRDEIDFRAVRRKGLGGSDVAAVLGVHPYQTAHDVWLDKMGLKEREENEAMRWGKLLEPVIATEYAVREGVKFLALSDQQRFIRHPKHQWMRGHIDRLVAGQPVGMDAKATDPRSAHRWGEPGTDEMPDEHLAQMQHYLAILEHVERWDVAILIGNRMHIYRVRPNPEIHKIIIEVCGEWWERYVVGQTPPPVDHSYSARKMLERLYPYNRGEIRMLPPGQEPLIEGYRTAVQQMMAAENSTNTIRNQICQIIGEDDGIQGPFGQITWRRTKDSQKVDWEAVARCLWNELALPASLKKLPAFRSTEGDLPTLSEGLFNDIVQRYTTPTPGVRRFVPKWEK